MIIYLGADHRGFSLKETIKSLLRESGYDVVDKGALDFIGGDDYPKYAAAVAREISKNPEGRGILICGSGIGVDVVANKFPGVRSALAISARHVAAARNDDDVNVLSIAADFTGADDAAKIVEVFLTTPFAHEPRFERRLREIGEIEQAE